MKIDITVRKIKTNIIEFDVATLEDWEDEPEVRTYHANSYATFHGPHSGGSAIQMHGPAHSPLRETNQDMVYEFKKLYPRAKVHFA